MMRVSLRSRQTGLALQFIILIVVLVIIIIIYFWTSNNTYKEECKDASAAPPPCDPSADICGARSPNAPGVVGRRPFKATVPAT